MVKGQRFGGDWTEEKLAIVEKYLVAYMQVMKKQAFRTIYIDAFAGTGYREIESEDGPEKSLFPEVFESDATGFRAGSAQRALSLSPGFDRYIFIEKNPDNFDRLLNLKNDFPDKRDRINAVQQDCNSYLEELCKHTSWNGQRAVIFLDPFGTQVNWNTIESIARTKSIDFWMLFPLGAAVNRMLTRDGRMPIGWERRLTEVFGTSAWQKEFYVESDQQDFFEEYPGQQKVANFSSIGRFLISRLDTVFSKVANNPRPLYNSTNNPLYLLVFAAGNPNGAPIAVKIAEHILGRI